MDKGSEAIKLIVAQAPACEGRVELVQLDVGDEASVAAAAQAIKEKIGGEPLYGLVNNAGTGLAHGVDSQTMIDTNYWGVKRVTEAFLPLLAEAGGRIVTVGSGAGPKFVQNCSSKAIQALMCSPTATVEEIEGALSDGLALDGMKGYGVSKAAVQQYTAAVARSHPGLVVSTVSPGFIDTAIVKGFGATKPPEEGTVSIRHSLFESLEGSGWYFGSDAVRSPLHFMRNPGEPAYDGVVPSF